MNKYRANNKSTPTKENPIKQFNGLFLDGELTRAIARKELGYIKKLLEAGANPNMRADTRGNTYIHRASISRDYELAKLLLMYGANPNRSNSKRDTPLIFSSIHDDTRMASLLIKYGADVNRTNYNQKTPLMFAAEHGAVGVAKLLIENGAFVSARMLGGKEALAFAIESRNPEICKLIISKMKSIEDPELLILAIKNYQEEVAAMLIQNGINFNCKCSGKYPLIEAVRYTLGSTVEMLINKGADVNVMDDANDTPLSVDNGKYRIMLKNAGAKSTFMIRLSKIIKG